MRVLPCLRTPDLNPPPADIAPVPVRVQVAGDVVALLIKEVPDSAGAHLEIWNWENSPQYSVCSSIHFYDYHSLGDSVRWLAYQG